MLGGDGGFPSAGGACSGYLVEAGDFRLLIDPGYATFPRLAQKLAPERLDAVLVSHGHPDHCADLNPLLRARTLRPDPPCPPLAVHALPGALDAVLRLDRPAMLDRAIDLHALVPGTEFTVGPFRIACSAVPHFVPAVGFRLRVGKETLAYTGDTGPTTALLPLANAADLLLAEATYVDDVPPADAGALSSARQAGELAHRAKVRRLLLTHLWPGTDRDRLEHAARRGFAGAMAVVEAGATVDLAHRVPGHQSF